MTSVESLPDLDSPEHIAEFVELFYQKLLADEQLAPIFNEVANIDINKHLPLICAYWEKLLLGNKVYQRHTMNIHRNIHRQRVLTAGDYQRWLYYFKQTISENFKGKLADKAVKTATSIAFNMEKNL